MSEGYTLHYKGAFNGAFLYGWMIIETFLAKLWIEYVNLMTDRIPDGKDALRDFRSWTGYHHIEIFYTVGQLTPIVRNLLNKLRKVRNDIIHKRRDVALEESWVCLRVAMVLLLNRLRNPDSHFKDIENIKLL